MNRLKGGTMKPIFYIIATRNSVHCKEGTICAVIDIIVNLKGPWEAFLIITPERRYRAIPIKLCKHYCFNETQLPPNNTLRYLDNPFALEKNKEMKNE